MNSLSFSAMADEANSYSEELENEQGTCSDSVSSECSGYYTDDGFWSKIKKHYKQVGRRLLSIAVTLFYTLRDDSTPKWARNVIIGALGYFVLPLDILPDFVPIAGFTDDLATITIALGAVAMHIKEEHKQKAKDVINRIF